MLGCSGKVAMHPHLPRLRTLLPIKSGDVSRAQRSAAALSSIATDSDPRCAAEPGPSESVTVPDQRCTTRARTDAIFGHRLRALALHRIRDTLLVTTALMALGVPRVAAGPDGANVVGGAATIQGQGGPSVIINQSTPSAIINW